MLANLVKTIFPGNTSQTFEKARVQATYDGDTNPPLGKDLANIISTLKDKNSEIRGTTAFYLTLANIQTNKAKPWNYILKNFVLFDKIIDEKCFVKEISELELNQIGVYKMTPGKHGEKLDLLLKRYFRYLKAKGRIYNTKHLQFNLPYEQQKHYINLLDKEKLFLESKRLRSLIILAFDVFEMGHQEITKYKLNQFIFVLVLNAIAKVLSSQYLIFFVISEGISSLCRNKILELYENFKQFFYDMETLLSYCNKLKTAIPGFEITPEQIYNVQIGSAIFQSLEGYINAPKIESLSTPKTSVINLAPFAQGVVPQHEGDDYITEGDMNTWNDVQKLTARDFNIERSCHSPDKDGSLKMKTPKSFTATFKESFHVGFKHLMNEDKENLIISKEKSIKKLKSTKSLNEQNINHNPELFNRLLCLEEADELFDQYANLYSSDYLDIPKAEAAQRVINGEVQNKFILKGQAYGHGNIVTQLSFELGKIEDFSQDLFENFKNTYSDS